MIKDQAIETARAIDGWMHPEELQALYDWASEMESIVEIGSWKGRSTYVLCKGTRGTVTAVDTFEGTPDESELLDKAAESGGSVYPEFARNMAGCTNLRAIRSDSVKAALLHPEVDMVFIDGGHAFEQVVSDLRAWIPKARKLICGHDYSCESVKLAVHDVLGHVDEGPITLWCKRVAA